MQIIYIPKRKEQQSIRQPSKSHYGLPIYLIHIPLLIVYLKLLIRLLFHKVTQ